jgi:hypothetical protein
VSALIQIKHDQHGIDALYIKEEFITRRSISRWDRDVPAPPAGKLAGAVSSACWLGILVYGRQIGWTMYPERRDKDQSLADNRRGNATWAMPG